MSEKQAAVLTAGVLSAAVGLFFVGVPSGVLYGAALLFAGAVTIAITGARSWPEWKAANHQRLTTKSERLSTGKLPDPERFWNAEKRLKGVIWSAVGLAIGATSISLLHREADWGSLVVSGAFIVIAGSSLIVLIWKHRRRPLAH